MAYPVCLPLRAGIPCAGLWLNCRLPSRLAGGGLIWFGFMGGFGGGGCDMDRKGGEGGKAYWVSRNQAPP